MQLGKFSLSRGKELIQNLIHDFFEDEITTRSAALAFYTALALAPLVILFVVILRALGFDIQKQFVSQAAGT